MTVIVLQAGATGWGFQVGRLYWQVNYWRYCFFRRHWATGRFELNIGHVGWDRTAR